MKRILMIITVASCIAFAGNANANENKHDFLIGVIVYNLDNVEEKFKELNAAGFTACQISYHDNYTAKTAERLIKAAKKYNIKPTAMITGCRVATWNFLDGPSTIGIVPKKNRAETVTLFKEVIDFSQMANVPAILAHFGFIPEDPRNPLYVEFIETMKDLGNYAKDRGVDIHYETGQETPITLVRTIQDIGTGNIFINCDLANLVMYGKANPVDAVRVFGRYIKEFHAKDGHYPTDPYQLGKEADIPTGEVDFPEVIKELKKQGFTGALIIERELSGSQQEYVLMVKNYLNYLINKK